MIENIVVFGGAFDPIHQGHINMALKAQEFLGGIDKCLIIFVPAYISVWKNEAISKDVKAEMVEMEINKHPSFIMSRFELNQDSPQYSYLTIKHFKEIYPDKKLYLLIGGDHVNSFHKWKNAEEIIKDAQIIYYNRARIILNKDNITKYHMINIPGASVDISSSDVRDLNALNDISDDVIYLIDKYNLYYMEKIKSFIDEKRFNHSKSVARLSLEIAKANNIPNYWRYYVAGLLHDIGKHISIEDKKDIEERYQEYMPMDIRLYHQFLGADIAKKEFNIQDEEILDAIRYHATGRKNMSKMDKVIYAADKCDPLRGYDSSDMIKAMKEDIETGFIYVLKENLAYLKKKMNVDISNKLTKECFDYYLG